MKVYYIVGIVCIAAMVITALIKGYDGVLAGTGISAIVGLITWQGTRAALSRAGNLEAVSKGMRKAGYSEKSIARTINRIKGGK